MIVYDLICDEEHEFESWFKSSAAYDSLRKSRKVLCPVCGSAKVRKAPMAPRISKSGIGELAPPATSDPEPSAPTTVPGQDDMA